MDKTAIIMENLPVHVENVELMRTKRIEKITLPSAAVGNERYLSVVRYGAPSSLGKIYIQAGLHADEPPGFLVMHHLMEMLDKADGEGLINGEIVLVPVANPIGLSQWRSDELVGRFEFATGVNFNRNHLDLSRRVAEGIEGRLTDDGEKNKSLIREEIGRILEADEMPAGEGEYLKRVLYSLSYDADIAVDLHCDHEAVVHIYTGTPLWPGAADLSAQMGAEVTLVEKKSGANPFDEALSGIWWELEGRFPDNPVPSACFASTLELRGRLDVTEEDGLKDTENLFYFMQRRGFIKGEAPPLPELIRDATPLSGVAYVAATVPGVVVYLGKLGQEVKKGDIVARIVNPLAEGNRVTEVEAPIDGVLFTRRLDRYARPMGTLVKIAGETPIEGKGEHLLSP